MGDQELVERFISSFAQRLSSKFKEEIDFILLFGSAARGEWKRGVSDIDVIIQTKGRKKEVKKYAETIFWELDSALATGFSDVCSIARKSGMEGGIAKLESRAYLYVPFEVIETGEIDWEKASINVPLGIVADFVAPKSILFLKIKNEGKVVYGRDIRSLIPSTPIFFERLKVLVLPQVISIVSLLLSPFFPNLALRRSIKAVLYSTESSLFFLGRPVGGSKLVESIEELKKELKGTVPIRLDLGSVKIDKDIIYDAEKRLDYSIVDEALRWKYGLTEGFEIGRRKSALFCSRAAVFIIRLNVFIYLKYKAGQMLPSPRTSR